MNRKEFLANILYASGMLSICRKLVTANNGYLPILGYHRVKPFSRNYAYDEHLISATPEQFLWQMQHIKNYYTPIKLVDIGKYSATTNWPKRPVIITFDDGFDDNYHYAYPILKQLGIPATFFLTTDYIGSNKSYWFDWVVFLLKKLNVTLLLKTSDGKQSFILEPVNALKQQRPLFGFLKSVSDAERKNLIQQLEQAASINHNPELSIESRAMNWDQAREMSADNLFSFGSHSQSHPALNQLSRETLIAELQLSKQLIETELGKPCETLAYPFGGSDITTADRKSVV